MCAACDADLRALGKELEGALVLEAEACAMRIEILDRIDRILDGHHSTPPVPPPWTMPGATAPPV